MISRLAKIAKMTIITNNMYWIMTRKDKITINTAEEIRQNYFLPKLLLQEISDNKNNIKLFYWILRDLILKYTLKQIKNKNELPYFHYY